MSNTLQSPTIPFAPHHSELLGDLPISARLARATLGNEAAEPAVLVSSELRLRRMAFKIIAESTRADIDLSTAEIPLGDDFLYSDNVVDELVTHYTRAMAAALEDPEILAFAIRTEVEHEQHTASQEPVYGSTRKPITSLLKKIQYSQTKKQANQNKLNRLVYDDYTNLVGQAVREGANTVFALFQVVPAVLQKELHFNTTEDLANESEALARTVTRLSLEWSGLSKLDDRRAALTLSDQKPDPSKDPYARLRFNPDYFYRQVCPKTGKVALGVKPEVMAFDSSQEVRYGCPAYAKGGITKMCRAIERKLVADQYYRQIQTIET